MKCQNSYQFSTDLQPFLEADIASIRYKYHDFMKRVDAYQEHLCQQLSNITGTVISND